MQTFDWHLGVARNSGRFHPCVDCQDRLHGCWSRLSASIPGSWQLRQSPGLLAKENVVGTLAVCFVGLENLIDTEELAMMEGAGAEVAGILAITKVAALAYLMFNLYTPPCFAAIGAMNSEMKSAKVGFWRYRIAARRRLYRRLPGLYHRYPCDSSGFPEYSGGTCRSGSGCRVYRRVGAADSPFRPEGAARVCAGFFRS